MNKTAPIPYMEVTRARSEITRSTLASPSHSIVDLRLSGTVCFSRGDQRPTGLIHVSHYSTNGIAGVINETEIPFQVL